jgi:hypothetical protein
VDGADAVGLVAEGHVEELGRAHKPRLVDVEDKDKSG